MGRITLITEHGKQEMTIKRLFDAPVERLFKAMTDPDLIPRWWGPRKYATIVDRADFRVGGQWRYINRAADGTEFGFHGVYHAIEAPRRLVQTFEFEGTPGHVSLETMTLEDRGGRTLVTAHSVFQSVADRDGMMQGGMEDGVNETYDRLEELVLEGSRA
jgi:uncharacterized protein YndB with AHSA1/START domain